MIKTRYILIPFLAVLAMSCDRVERDFDTVDAPDMLGENISFCTGVYGKIGTKSYFADEAELNSEVSRYERINDDYELNVEMYVQGDPSVLASAVYTPTLKSGSSEYVDDGTLSLKFTEKGLKWTSNEARFGFKATAKPEELAVDQTDQAKWFANDKLTGYGFSAVWGGSGANTDQIDEMNFHTSKEWYAANKSLNPGGTPADWKKIPLYMRHDRSWVTVILKAGKGVNRTDIQNKDFVDATIYSYSGSGDKEIQPWEQDATIDYEDATGVATIKYDAIVEPYNYLAQTDKNIVRVVLGSAIGAGLNFTFKSANDFNYSAYVTGSAKDPSDRTSAETAAINAMQAYNLSAGKHLTITSTLTTDRVVLITALLEDWDEMSMISICDDFGKNGDPIVIDSPARLREFLLNPEENKDGNIAIISAASMTLPNDWEPQDLNCTLNLAGSTIHTPTRMLNSIAKNGILINGIVNVIGTTPGETAICLENRGIVQQIDLTVKPKSALDPDIRQIAAATRAGIAVTNYGSIYRCSSDLRVIADSASPVYVGGIAAESKFADTADPAAPRILRCTMTNKVGTTHDLDSDYHGGAVTGLGGIAGYAEGEVSQNVFDFGLTLIQQTFANYKNIMAATSTDVAEYVVSADGNEWPTTVDNTIGVIGHNNVNAASVHYAGVISDQEELALVIESYNASANSFRIAENFEIGSAWPYGYGEGPLYTDENRHLYDIKFNLDGNNKVITTHGTMVFSHVNSLMRDIIIHCAESLVTPESENPENAERLDVISAFAYSVNSVNESHAELSNIRVRMLSDDLKIQAAQPAGIVVWAYDKGIVSNCEVQAKLVSVLTNLNGDAKRYAGGVVASVCDARIEGCIVHTGTSIEEAGSPKHPKLYMGAIAGGTVKKIETGTNPAANIVDCISWWGEVPPEGHDYSSNIGAIIGNSLYNTDITGTVGCIGNWWSYGKPVGNCGTKRSDYEDTIGYKNNVGPIGDVIDY